MSEYQDYDYDEDIICARCNKLIGYAPYWRQEYLCVECYKQIANQPSDQRNDDDQ